VVVLICVLGIKRTAKGVVTRQFRDYG
jgi:hypothetical protein